MKKWCMHLLLKVAIILNASCTIFGFRCERTPEHTFAPRSKSDGRYIIEVSGNPDTYVPGEQYTIFLRSNPELQIQHKFKDFLLLVEHEPTEKILGEVYSPSVGSLQLYGDMLTKFSEKCRNAVMQTNSLPKSEIQVLWLAPPAGSGCVAIRASVVESRDIWFADEGPLSKILCEELQESEDTQPNVLRHCCACDEAKYEVTFEGLWSRNTHPKDFPSNGWLTRFSDIIGASHAVDYTFWNYGDIASEGLRQLAENGNTRMLESELKAKSEHIRTIIKARGISYPNITGKTFAVFRVDNRHHLMSLVSMIDPSPDWIVGVSSLELCLRNCSWVESRVLNLYPWDAGTDDGPTYISPNQPSSPRHPIRRIKSNSPNDQRSPFFDPTGAEMKPLARLYLSRQRLYEKTCDPSIMENNEEYENNNNDNCQVDKWSEWSPCSATCGKGTKYKQRGYKNEESKYHCNRELTRRAHCEGIQKHCRNQPQNNENDPQCALTEWGEFSSCSVTCGKGWKTRSRRYKNRAAAKKCTAGNENPSHLQDNLPCEEAPCRPGDENELIYKECESRMWSLWSPCSASCGKGIKVRTKLKIDMGRNRRYTYPRYNRGLFDQEEDDDQDDEDEDDPCASLMEKVECVNDEYPVCDENENYDSAVACSLPKDEGGCKSNVDRWYFDVIKGSCDIFSYSGCQGNKNNFKTLERCERVCNGYKKELIANRTAQKRQLGVTLSGVLAYNMQLQNDDADRENCVTENYFGGIEPSSHTIDRSKDYKKYAFENNVIEEPTGDVTDCQMSSWSNWSPCNTTCGKGYKFKHRFIKVNPSNGGKKCSEKLMKKRKCRVPCGTSRDISERDPLLPSWGPTGSLENIKVDCVMSKWSAWSPCSRSCGPNAVQQRTRSILIQASGKGQPCLHRTEERPCTLLACPE